MLLSSQFIGIISTDGYSYTNGSNPSYGMYNWWLRTIVVSTNYDLIGSGIATSDGSSYSNGIKPSIVGGIGRSIRRLISLLSPATAVRTMAAHPAVLAFF